MTDNSPMLHQDADLSPMLGGDRAHVEPCESCHSPRIRDFFGTPVCPVCAAAKRKSGAVTRGRLPDDPAWFNAGKTTPEVHIRNVRAGRHPMGFTLMRQHNPADSTCGNCAFRQRLHYHTGTYNKCKLTTWTHGPASDLRLDWAACAEWQEREEE